MDEQRVRQIVQEELAGIVINDQPALGLVPTIYVLDMNVVANRLEERLLTAIESRLNIS